MLRTCESCAIGQSAHAKGRHMHSCTSTPNAVLLQMCMIALHIYGVTVTQGFSLSVPVRV